MSEPLTNNLLSELIAKLHAAFPRNIGEKNPAMVHEIYRTGLRGISGDAVRAAVDKCIQVDQYFPKVARLRDYAFEYNRRTNALPPRPVAWDECAVCGAKAERVGERTRIMHDPRAHGIKPEAHEASA